MIYPDVAGAVVDWLLAGAPPIDQGWVRSVWSRVIYRQRDDALPTVSVRYA